MLGGILQWVQMPPTPAILIYPPHPLTFFDQSKSHRLGDLVEIETHKHILTYVKMALGNRSIGVQIDLPNQIYSSQGAHKLKDEDIHIH